MQHQVQVQLARRLLDHMANGTTDRSAAGHRNPVSSYTSSERLEDELTTVLREHPLLVGLSKRISNVGDYVTEDLAGVPVVVCRDDAGDVRAFVNMCRHRGARIADGCGSARHFVCPYHAWTYKLDGGLYAIPSAIDFDAVDKESSGLVELSSAERHGLVFVQLNGEIDLDASLGGLDHDFAAYGFEDFHHYRTLTLRRKMNWKLSPETFMEGYHLKYLHRDSVGPYFVSNLMTFDAFGRNSRVIVPRKSIKDLEQHPEADWNLIPNSSVIYNLFPNTTFVIQTGHVEMWRSFPAGSPNEARIEVSVYTPQKAESDKAKAFYDKNIDLAMQTVDGEDFPLCEVIQTGHMAAMQDHVTYGRNEPALIHYCQSVEAALRSKPDSPTHQPRARSQRVMRAPSLA